MNPLKVLSSPSAAASHHAAVNDVVWVAVDEIAPNPHQPRRYFDEAEIKGLADSIKQHGVLQNLILRPLPAGKRKAQRYEIVSGERRWRAAQAAGEPNVPCIVRELSPLQAREIALIENVQRESLTDMEEARGIADYMSEAEKAGQEISQNQMARKLGKSVSFVRNRLQLVLAKPDIQALAEKHRNVMSSCLEIEKVSDPYTRSELIEAVDNGASYTAVVARIQTAKADAAWKRDSQTAPDKFTAQAQGKAAKQESEARQAVEGALIEIERLMLHAKAYYAHLSARDKKSALERVKRLKTQLEAMS